MKNADNIEIRQPVGDELELVRVLRHKVLDQDRANDFELALGDRDYNPTTIHMAAFVNDELISTVRLDEKQPGLYEVRKMATDALYRNKGLGASVLSAAEKMAVDAGAHTFTLASRPKAVPFYASLGYVSTGEQVTHDDQLLNFIMKKRV